MSRFIPMDVQERTLSKEKFYVFLENKIANILQELHSIMTI